MLEWLGLIPLLGLTGNWRGYRMGGKAIGGASMSTDMKKKFEQARAAGDMDKARAMADKAQQFEDAKKAGRSFSGFVTDPETGEAIKVSSKTKDSFPEEVTKKFESMIRKDSIETGIIVDADGKVVLKKKGTETQVRFTPDEIVLMAGKVLTHNHPRQEGYDSIGIGHSLSKPDLVMATYSKAKEIRAVTGEGSTFSMRINNPDSIPEPYPKRVGYFNRMWGNTVKKSAVPKLQKMFQDGHITKSEYSGEAGLHLANRHLANKSKGVFSYSATFENSAGAERIKALEKIFDEI